MIGCKSLNKREVLIACALVIFVISVMAVISPAQANETEDQVILILVGPQYGLPIPEAIIPAIVGRLQQGGVSLDEIYVEHLDLHRSDDEQHRANLLNMLQHKLKDSNLSIIIAVNQGAVDFVANEGKDLFPQAPLIIPILEKEPVWAGTPRPLITLSSRQDAEGTLKQALTLFPATERVVLISGKDDHRAPFLEPIKSALAALPTALIVEDTAALTHQEMMQYIASLPEGTIVFYGSYFEDVTGESFIPAEVAAEIAAGAGVPVFAFRDMHIMQGLVGGSVVLTSDLGVMAAELALDYLNWDLELSDPNITFEVRNIPYYNYQQIKHFGADPEKLPANTVFFNRTPNLWEEYKTVIVIGASLLIALVILSVFLALRNRQLGQAKQELQHYSKNLDSMIAERTAQLEAVNRELEAFSYSVSHDLRAPLRSLQGFSSMLLSEYDDRLDESGRHYLQRIDTAARRMKELIEDLLALSQISKKALTYKQVDLATLAKTIIKGLRDAEPQRQAEVAVASELSARGDEKLLRVALENLIGNAWKFTAKQSQAKIEVGIIYELEGIVYFIRDNGAGFDMAYADKLFNPFQRLHGVDEFPGTGIGLATVQRIINRHGGRIWAEGEVGKGAAFFFTLGRGKE